MLGKWDMISIKRVGFVFFFAKFQNGGVLTRLEYVQGGLVSYF